MRLLLADELDREPFEELPLLGVEVIYQPSLTAATLGDALRGAHILVVSSTRVTADVLEAAPELSLIVVTGLDVGVVDVEAASARGIYVANCSGQTASAVAETAFSLILALDRKLVEATSDLRGGRWEPARYQGARGLDGRRIGIAGLGAVGRRVLECARAFGMEAHVWSRSLTPAGARRLDVGYAATLEQLAARSDVFSIHLALRPDTRGVISRQVLEALPEEAIVVQTAHPAIVDYDALRELVAQKGLRVGLDLYPDEPSGDGGGLLELSGERGLVYGTPHIASSTRQAEKAVAGEVCRIVRAFLTEEEVPNVVNVCRNTPARFTVVLRMKDEVGVLANALNVIKRHGINVEEVTNTVFDGARAGCTKLRVSGRPTESCLQEISAFHEVLYVDVIQLPNLA
ncbi:MAG: D-3-phosphoglycerate dehydrogenase [Deltaproteobacteria bacterium]|jgi:D-3-phosphoglycerate dehydrogenase|nr:D-3-phosphoglycerate dehydrogenase [Deltaproteobacteria bacterium]MBW2531393.1 D-3-phosphoglycerate dehydrogenase [Deltaproteobacteria bacterium]